MKTFKVIVTFRLDGETYDIIVAGLNGQHPLCPEFANAFHKTHGLENAQIIWVDEISSEATEDYLYDFSEDHLLTEDEVLPF